MLLINSTIANIHKGDTERITIAFDLLTKKESDIFIKL